MHFPVTDFDAEYDRLTKPGIKFDEPPENKLWVGVTRLRTILRDTRLSSALRLQTPSRPVDGDRVRPNYRIDHSKSVGNAPVIVDPDTSEQCFLPVVMRG
jgi:hypothetical protein